MALMQITIVPVGTGSTSVGDYVAGVQKMLRERGGTFELTDMGTVVYGTISELLQLAMGILLLLCLHILRIHLHQLLLHRKFLLLKLLLFGLFRLYSINMKNILFLHLMMRVFLYRNYLLLLLGLGQGFLQL